jgi:hypothetical protein
VSSPERNNGTYKTVIPSVTRHDVTLPRKVLQAILLAQARGVTGKITLNLHEGQILGITGETQERLDALDREDRVAIG